MLGPPTLPKLPATILRGANHKPNREIFPCAYAVEKFEICSHPETVYVAVGHISYVA